MAVKLAQGEIEQLKELLYSIEELLISNANHIDAVVQLLVRKGIFTDEELSAELKEVQMEYKSKDNA